MLPHQRRRPGKKQTKPANMRVEPLEDRWLLDVGFGQLAQNFGAIPLSFEANLGQISSQVDYLARGPGYTVFLTPGEAVLTLQNAVEVDGALPRIEQDVLRIQLTGANQHAQAHGIGALGSQSNYLLGDDPSKWLTGIGSNSRVRYDDIYNGIDLVYYGNQRQLEYDFVVAPGIDPSAINLAFEGAEGVSLDTQGNLVLKTAHGSVIQRAPSAYQEYANGRRAVESHFRLGADGQVHFEIGSYDPNKELIIDPVMSYSTYLGGSGPDSGQAIALDSAGNIYVTGFTSSNNFPTKGAAQGGLTGNTNVFVSKLNPSGTALIYSTYLGGNDFDIGIGLKVDGSGNAYVVGVSTSDNFPTKGAFQARKGGASDTIVFKLNPAGSALVWSTYLGGTETDFGQGIEVDGASNVYVGGFTTSANFPIANALQGQHGGSLDGFVTKFNAQGSGLIYSTFVGGAGEDNVQGLAIDGAASVYLTGTTNSANYPTKNPLQAYGGGGDAFLTKIAPLGNSYIYSTYLGGSNEDRFIGVAVDSSGNVYLAGSTTSTNLPTVRPAQAAAGGGLDGYVAKVDLTGSRVVYSTYLGGVDEDRAQAIAVDAAGNAYVTGATYSTAFPTVNPTQAKNGGMSDAFVTRLSPTGEMTFSTYLGGTDEDRGFGIVADNQSNVYVTGSTSSANFPTLNPLQGGQNGGIDGFVARFSFAPASQFTVEAPSSTAGNKFSVTITARDPSGNVSSDYTGTVRFTSSDPQAVLPAEYTFTAADKGVHTFTGLQLKTQGTHSIVVTDTKTASLTGSKTGIAVGPTVASLAVTGLPAATTAGSTNSVTITARDAQGNTATGYTGTVHFTSSDPRASLPADYTFTAADKGVHTFTGVFFKTVGTQSLSVADTGLTGVAGTQSGITVNRSAVSLATHLGLPAPVGVNAGSSFLITVSALDATNDVADDYVGTVRFTSSDLAAVLPADYTFTAADKGVHTFSVTMKTVGSRSLTVTDKVTPSISGTLASINVNPPIGSLSGTSPATSLLAGTTTTITITAKDVVAGLATGYTGTVHFTSSDPQAVLPPDYTFTAADLGTHTFNVTFKTTGSQTVTVRDKNDAAITNSQSTFTVTTVASALSLTGMPTSVGAGSAQSVTVTIKDDFGNTVTDYVGTVRFTSSDPQAILPADYKFTATEKGVHVFAVTLRSPGSHSITVADTVTSGLSASQSGINVTAVPTTLAVAGFPPSVNAGEARTLTVTIRDAQGNAVTNYTGTVHFTSSDAAAVLPADYTFTSTDRGAHTFTVTLKTAGTHSITVVDKAVSSLTGSQTGITVNAVAGSLSVTGLPTNANTGESKTFTVTIRDAQGFVFTGYTGTMHFTSSDAQAVLPADYKFTAADQGTHTFAVTFKTPGTHSVTAGDTANIALSGSQSGITVRAVASTLSITGVPTATNQGTAFSYTITAKDAFGNLATGYTGRVHFSSSDSQAILPADYTFVAADAGTHTFSATLSTPGSQNISVAEATAGTVTGAQASTTVAAVAGRIALSGLPATVRAGESQSVTVTILDALGNPQTAYTGTVRFTSSDGAATLPADYTFTAADKGTKTFAVTFKTVGSQSLSVTDKTDGTLSATQAGIDVRPVATKIVMAGFPATTDAGAAHDFTVTITDDAGNRVTDYTGTVHFTSSDSSARLPADYTFTAGDQGRHTFSLTLQSLGSQSLTVSDRDKASLTATQNGITVRLPDSAPATKLTVSTPQRTRVGTSFTIMVTALNAANNPATSYRGTVRFQSSDAQAVLPANYTFVASDNGVHVFQVTLGSAGMHTITVTDAADSALSITSSSIETVTSLGRTWTGLGGDAKWSSAGNWTDGVVPQSGDSLIFGTTTAATTRISDIPKNFEAQGITFLGNGYILGGDGIVVSGPIDAGQASGANTINAPLRFTNSISLTAGPGTATTSLSDIDNAGFTLTVAGGSGSVVVGGVLSGTGGLLKTSTGSLTLSGTAGNTYSGLTSVQLGILRLDKSAGDAIAGALKIGDGQGGSGADRVVLNRSQQIADTAAVTIESSGQLDLAGKSEVVGPIAISGGSITTGAGLLTLNSNLKATAAGGTISGAVSLPQNRTIDVLQGAVLNLNGRVHGTGGLIKDGAGTLVLAGAESNSYFGTTLVKAGSLTLNKSSGEAIAGPLVIGEAGQSSTASVQLQAPNQIADGVSIVVAANGVLDLGSQSETIGSLTLSGGTINGGTLILTGDVTASAGSSTVSSKISLTTVNRNFAVARNASLTVAGAILGPANAGLTKTGTGTLTLAGNNTYKGITNVLEGTLLINGSQSASQVRLQPGAILGGTGTTGKLLSTGGTISQGDKLGTLTVTGDTAFPDRLVVAVKLTPQGSDQIKIVGKVSLGGSTLTVSAPGIVSVGTKLTILSTTAGVSGTFKGLPEGATLLVSGRRFKITYKGGVTGKDVALTAL